MIKDKKILEAILFASTEPIIESELINKISDKNKFNQYIYELQNEYKERGVNLIKTSNKWSFRTSVDLSESLSIHRKQRRKISRAALETLAIIAYQQPITRAEIENIRGVQMGKGSIDILLQIGWIKPKGRRNSPGRPSTWGTTDLFLEHFQLENLDFLPNKEELIASGFLDKRAAISAITDLTSNNQNEELASIEDTGEEMLEDFISDKENI